MRASSQGSETSGVAAPRRGTPVPFVVLGAAPGTVREGGLGRGGAAGVCVLQRPEDLHAAALDAESTELAAALDDESTELAE